MYIILNWIELRKKIVNLKIFYEKRFKWKYREIKERVRGKNRVKEKQYNIYVVDILEREERIEKK